MLHTDPDLTGSGHSGSTLGKVDHMPFFLATSSTSFLRTTVFWVSFRALHHQPLSSNPVHLPLGQQRDVFASSMSRVCLMASSLQVMLEHPCSGPTHLVALIAREQQLMRTSMSRLSKISVLLTQAPSLLPHIPLEGGWVPQWTWEQCLQALAGRSTTYVVSCSV